MNKFLHARVSRFAMLSAILLLVITADAATIAVVNTNDALAGSLRQAIQDANPGDTIIFQIPTTDLGYEATRAIYTITLTTASSTDSESALVIAKNLTIDGGNSRIIVARSSVNSTPQFRIFNVSAGTVTLANLTIYNGYAGLNGGGGILNSANLTVRGCAVANNFGGAGGGGIENSSGATLEVRNCTFYSNTTASAGRAIESDGILFLNNSTVCQNPAGMFGPSAAVAGLGSSTHVRNTIIALNENNGPYSDVQGTFISDGYNFIGDPLGGNGIASSGFGLSGSHDQVGTYAAPANPKLTNVDFLNGPTPTYRPQAGSPVLDQGSRGNDASGQPVNIDQRGQPRPVDQPGITNAPGGDSSDIGAVEVGLPQAGPTFTVTDVNDHDDGSCTSDDCTLREALNAANANADANTISFAPGVTGIIQLGTVLPDITTSVVIQGPGARVLTVQRSLGAATNFRIFNVAGSVTATISSLTVANGNLPGGLGGGILSHGSLTLDKVTLINNAANGGNGGGIYSAGPCVITNSTIYGNTVNSSTTAGSGGGIFNFGATLTITNSSIAANSATCTNTSNDSGGGIYSNVGNVTLTNDTITGNSGDIGGGVTGANGAVVRVRNTIIALNTSSKGSDVNGNFTSDGHNFIGKAFTISGSSGYSTGFTDGVNGDQVGAGTASAPPKDPKFATFGNNGGPTDTMALLSTSTAINAGNDSFAPGSDQRGYFRNGVSDIGAFEFNGIAPVPPTVITGAATNITSTTATLNATVNPNGLDTTVQFVTNFGTFSPQDIGSGTSNVPVSVDVTGLAPNTQYSFSITATSLGGTTQGVQQTFATLPGPTPTATPTATPAGLVANVSTRLPVGTNDNVLIEGFIVQGPAGSTKKILIRAIGPSLVPFGVTDALANPTLEIDDANNATIATNDDWRTTQVGGIITGDQSGEIGGSGLAPGNDLESAIIADLPPGSYTAIVRGLGNTVGTGVVDAYDLSGGSAAKLANIATRGLIQPGDQLMIAGFIIQNGPVRAVVRAIGPSLTAFGVNNALPDTTLQIEDQNGTIVIENDDWQSDQKQELENTGLQPSNDLEAAVLVTLPPGQYSALVRGKPETTGTGVVQVYFLQ
jgi:CSLREA domain-containing protein